MTPMLLTDELSFWHNVVDHSDRVLLYCTDDAPSQINLICPYIVNVLSRYNFTIRFCCLNVNTTPELSQKLDLPNVPAILLLRYGQVIGEYEGRFDPTELETFIENHW